MSLGVCIFEVWREGGEQAAEDGSAPSSYTLSGETGPPLGSPGSCQPSSCWSPHLGPARRVALLLRGAWSLGKKGTQHTT